MLVWRYLEYGNYHIWEALLRAQKNWRMGEYFTAAQRFVSH